MAKLDLDDPYVFYAQLSVTDDGFTTHLTYDMTTDTLQSPITFNNRQCVARSADRGRSFPLMVCTPAGDTDGATLAVARNAVTGGREVYLAGTFGVMTVWRIDGETMSAPVPLELPFNPSRLPFKHPRMRVFDGILYIANSGRLYQPATATFKPVIVVDRLDAAGGSTSWMGETIVVSDNDLVSDANPLLTGYPVPPTDRTVRSANLFSFDLGGDEIIPSLRFGGGRWVAVWRKRVPAGVTSAGNFLGTVAGLLDLAGGTSALVQRTLSPGAIPCLQGGYWGDYDEIDSFGDGRFFAGYTVNGPGCRWSGVRTADQHVGASVFGF